MFFKSIVLPATVVVSMGFLAKNTLANLFNSPIVYMNHVTGRCVAIETPGGVFGCSVIPKEHSVTFVGPNETLSDIKSRRKTRKN